MNGIPECGTAGCGSMGLVWHIGRHLGGVCEEVRWRGWVGGGCGAPYRRFQGEGGEVLAAHPRQTAIVGHFFTADGRARWFLGVPGKSVLRGWGGGLVGKRVALVATTRSDAPSGVLRCFWLA